MDSLKEIPNHQIHKKLRISFDGLSNDLEKNIFLDICCFFIGKDRNYATQILNGCGLHAGIGISRLIELSLLRVDKNNKLDMHNLIRDMGREIVREESPDEPGNRSRLWLRDNVIDVLRNHRVRIFYPVYDPFILQYSIIFLLTHHYPLITFFLLIIVL